LFFFISSDKKVTKIFVSVKFVKNNFEMYVKFYVYNLTTAEILSTH
jgi:hypothetical protein